MLIKFTVYNDAHVTHVISWLKNNPVYLEYAEQSKDMFNEKKDTHSWHYLIDLFFAFIPTYTDKNVYIESYAVLHLYENWDDIMT